MSNEKFEQKLNKLGINRVFTGIPKKKLDDAILFYAKKAERQSVIALVDDTTFFKMLAWCLLPIRLMQNRLMVSQIKYDEIFEIKVERNNISGLMVKKWG